MFSNSPKEKKQEKMKKCSKADVQHALFRAANSIPLDSNWVNTKETAIFLTLEGSVLCLQKGSMDGSALYPPSELL